MDLAFKSDFIVIQRVKRVEKSTLLISSEDKQEKEFLGLVVSGKDPFNPGSIVMYNQFGPKEVHYKGEDFLVCKEEDILGTVINKEDQYEVRDQE
jgi:co-chaperonin GroES (HSP10)